MQDEIFIDHGEARGPDSGGKDNAKTSKNLEGTIVELHAKPKPPKPPKAKTGKPAKHASKTVKPAEPVETDPMKMSAAQWRQQFKGKEYGVKREEHHAATVPTEAQLGVQLNVYRQAANGHYEYLLLNRTDQGQTIWQFITQRVIQSDTLIDSLRQAAIEQAGLHGFKQLSQQTYSYEWYAGNLRGRNIVFAAEVSANAAITISDPRFSTYAWLPYADAVQRVEWNGSKQALEQLDRQLQAGRSQEAVDTRASLVTHSPNGRTVIPPDSPSSEQPAGNGNAPTTPPVPVTTTTDGRSAHNPYGDNVPKRLPDVAEDGLDELKPYPEEDDERTGGWLL